MTTRVEGVGEVLSWARPDVGIKTVYGDTDMRSIIDLIVRKTRCAAAWVTHSPVRHAASHAVARSCREDSHKCKRPRVPYRGPLDGTCSGSSETFVCLRTTL